MRLLDSLEMRNIIPASRPQHCGGPDPDLQAELVEAVPQKHIHVQVPRTGAHASISTQQQGLGKMLSSMAAGAHRQLVPVGG